MYRICAYTRLLPLLVTVSQAALGQAAGSVIYWTADDPIGSNAYAVQRVRVGSNNVETLISVPRQQQTSGPYPVAVALDVIEGEMYWYDWLGWPPEEGTIRRANFDGSEPEEILTGLLIHGSGLALDSINGKIYWSAGQYDGRISRSSLDGSDREEVLPKLNWPTLLEVDAPNEHLYWADVHRGLLHRSNLDGGDVAEVMNIGVTGASALAYDIANQTVYWAQSQSIAKSDGTTTETIFRAGPEDNIRAIALDKDDDKIYFRLDRKIQRANLDGSRVEDVVTGVFGPGQNRPSSIAIDPTRPDLQAGDADQDLDFDVMDILQVQLAGRYLTGRPADWSQGDWDGAPGGNPGNPPPGNGVFDQKDIVAALAPAHYLSGPYAALRRNGQRGDAQTSVGYDPRTGEIWVDPPKGVELTSVNIDSAAGIFTGEPAANLGGSFDNDADNNIFKATFGGSFGSLRFGHVAQTGLSEALVLNDLTVVGSMAGGSVLGEVDLIYVPEPTTFALAIVGLLNPIRRRWNRKPGKV